MADMSGGVLATSSKKKECTLRMGSSITSQGGIARVGPFVRVEETGQLCFLTTKPSLIEGMRSGVKVNHIVGNEVYPLGTILIPAGLEGDVTLVSANPKYVPKDIGQIYRNRSDFYDSTLVYVCL
ncbi:uncharacterized protein LOC128558991 isoform X2 [Mercenaria mercenaria]|uniref:uncharacterized protein LOC128558991 isoform X2 n=1 Tax=Mercenaria mercenaria TaxID=6596 RepID=UPI00234EBE18|nr:uncharacterized protein LOC128558991 isoform X2 [Mercenaria mercenaria]